MDKTYMVLVADDFDSNLTLLDFDLDYTEAVSKATKMTEKFDTVIVCEHGKFQHY